MKNPNQRLLDLIAKYELTHMQVATYCRCGRTAVHYWTRDPSDPSFSVMSQTYLRLLELELREVRPKGKPKKKPKRKAA